MVQETPEQACRRRMRLGKILESAARACGIEPDYAPTDAEGIAEYMSNCDSGRFCALGTMSPREAAEWSRETSQSVPQSLREASGEVTREERAETWATSNLPEEFQDVEPDWERARDTSWLWLCGPVGVGKTRSVCSTAKALAGMGKHPVFVSEAEAFDRIKASFDGGTDPTIGYQRAEVLIVDDVGKTPLSEWSASVYFLIIDYRWSHHLQTLFTSQLRPSEWVDTAGEANSRTADAISSRLKGSCRVRGMRGVDRRGQKKQKN